MGRASESADPMCNTLEPDCSGAPRTSVPLCRKKLLQVNDDSGKTSYVLNLSVL